MDSPTTRKPGELIFAVLVVLASLVLFYSAYGISGFEALSAPGAIPMATTAVMVITSVLVVIRTVKRAPDTERNFFHEVMPLRIAIVISLLVAYAFALRPIGFLPTSAVFLILLIKLLSRRSWVFSVSIGLASLIMIYMIFRIIFTVLMPSGLVPEGEILAWLRNLLSGSN